MGPLHAVIAHSLGTAATTVALRDGLVAGRCVYLSAPSRTRYFTEIFCKALGLPAEVERRLYRRIEDRFDVNLEQLDGPAIARSIPTPPALIVHDRDDADVPFIQGAALAQAWSEATFVESRGLGHRAILRDPQIVQRAVSFLDTRS